MFEVIVIFLLSTVVVFQGITLWILDERVRNLNNYVRRLEDRKK